MSATLALPENSYVAMSCQLPESQCRVEESAKFPRFKRRIDGSADKCQVVGRRQSIRPSGEQWSDNWAARPMGGQPAGLTVEGAEFSEASADRSPTVAAVACASCPIR